MVLMELGSCKWSLTRICCCIVVPGTCRADDNCSCEIVGMLNRHILAIKWR